MKQMNITVEGMEALSPEEAKVVNGGGDILSYLKCVSGALGTGGGLFKSFVLGVTVFGMARVAGVMTGCAPL